MAPPLRYYSGIHFYNKCNGDYPLLVGEDIEGDTIDTLDEWYSHPYKYEIMADAMKFGKYLRTLSDLWWWKQQPYELGRCNRFDGPIDTAILRNHYNGEGMGSIFKTYRLKIENKYIERGTNPIVPESLIDSKLGRQILHDLENTNFSDRVFCHNYLCYKSFVLKNNKLIGIKNWQYSGFYPSEFEDVVQRYLEYIF